MEENAGSSASYFSFELRDYFVVDLSDVRFLQAQEARSAELESEGVDLGLAS